MSDPRPLGPIIDELGVTLQLDPDDRVTDLMVIAKTTDLESGEVGLSMSTNGLDWIAQVGLLTAAKQALFGADVDD